MQKTTLITTRTQSRKSMIKLLAIILVFIIPVMIAQFLYLNRTSMTFKLKVAGELLSTPLDSRGLDLPFDQRASLGKWQIVFFSKEHCDESCQQKRELLKRVHLALGKDQTRVIPQIIFSKSETESLSGLETNKVIWIIDPQGFVILKYPDTILTPAKAKGLLEDIQRLLKFSRIG